MPQSAGSITDPTSITWRTWDQDDSAEHGVVSVPLDWAEPDGPTIRRDVLRRRARRPDQRIGTLFVRYLMPAEFDSLRLSASLLDRFDLVGFDPWPQNCPAVAPVPSSGPRDAAAYARLRGYVAARSSETLARDPAAVLHVDAVSDAHDIDVVRRALGEEQLSFLSSRENELVGPQYLELYGEHVRAMVLDGNVDHTIDNATDYLVAKAGAVNDVVLAFADWAQNTPGTALYGRDARATFLQARENWGRLAPIVGERLMTAKVGGMVDPDEQPGEHNWHGLARIVAAAAEGTLGPRTTDEDLTVHTPFGADFGFQLPAWDDVLAVRAAMAQRAPYSLNNPMQWGLVMGVQGWDAPVRNPPRRLRIAPGLPVVVLRTRFDPGQPFAWGEAVAEQIPGASLLTYEGAGTGAYGLSPDCRSVVDEFLLSGQMPDTTSFPARWPS